MSDLLREGIFLLGSDKLRVKLRYPVVIWLKADTKHRDLLEPFHCGPDL